MNLLWLALTLRCFLPHDLHWKWLSLTMPVLDYIDTCVCMCAWVCMYLCVCICVHICIMNCNLNIHHQARSYDEGCKDMNQLSSSVRYLFCTAHVNSSTHMTGSCRWIDMQLYLCCSRPRSPQQLGVFTAHVAVGSIYQSLKYSCCGMARAPQRMCPLLSMCSGVYVTI